jgi:hypothetical protein
MIFDVPGSSVPLKIKLQCLGFALSGDFKKSPANCQHTCNNCKKKVVNHGRGGRSKEAGIL